jgi:ABC-2 type transport system ATP-binding protein
MPPAIDVADLVKVYPRRGEPPRRAVDGLGFAIAPGAIFGLLGPNGAGKTTTLKILTTLARPTSGRVTILGHDVLREPLAVRRAISVVIQETAVELFLSARDNLLTYARFYGLDGLEAARRADRAIALFGLADLGNQKAQDLSGGFRRRVQVAKTFMVDTPIVFLDEFSTGMDPLLKRAVMELLRGEAKRGRTIVLTTQILSEAEELCDDILIINHGRQVARGDLHSLKLLSEGVYEVALTFERVPDGLDAELAARGALRTRISGNTVEIALKADEQQVLALVSDLAKRGRVLRVELGGASLEDVFVELTQADAREAAS